MSEELYLDFASGAATPGLGLLTATKLAMRPSDAENLHDIEAVGSALFERLPAADLQDGALGDVMNRLDAEAFEAEPAAASPSASGLPAPLSHVLSAPLEDIQWRTVMPGVAEYKLSAASSPKEDVKLVKFQAGRTMPLHGHAGVETTLVLHGAYEDETGRFDVGDVTIADETVEHRPRVLGAEHCICLTVMSGSITVRRPLFEFARYFLQ